MPRQIQSRFTAPALIPLIGLIWKNKRPTLILKFRGIEVKGEPIRKKRSKLIVGDASMLALSP